MHGDVFEVGFGDGMHGLDQPGVHRSVAVGACRGFCRGGEVGLSEI